MQSRPQGAMLMYSAKESTMQRHKMLAGLAVLGVLGAAGAGCVPPENPGAFIEGILPISPAKSCEVSPNDNLIATSRLDIGVGANNANALVLAARVVTNLPNTFNSSDQAESRTRSPNYPDYGNANTNIINFQAAEAYFTTDADRSDGAKLEGFDLATDPDSPRRTGIGGTLYNSQTQLNTAAAIIATAITTDDAVILQGIPYVTDNIAASGQARILLNLRLSGVTSGGAEMRTPAFTFPVDLCAGCLVVDENDCTNGREDEGCVRGVDYPTVCAP